MKYNRILPLAFASAAILTACSDDNYLAGDPEMNINATLDRAFFGDSIPFTVKASDPDVALSTLRVELFFGEEVVSEKVIRTKENGADYTDKIFVPYYANIPDGTATLRMTLQNIHFTKKIEEFNVPISHPDYRSLTLRAEDGTEYTLDRSEKNLYTCTQRFPQEVKGKIIAPKYGENGNELIFGYENSAIKVGAEGYIPFSNSSAGKYTISFNSATFEGAPFVVLTINGDRLETIDETHSKIDLNLTKGDLLTPAGFPNYDDWWIDPDYFIQNEDGSLIFNAQQGRYRIIADTGLQYFRVYKLSGNDPATTQTDGTGAVWAIGDNIGFPSVSSNKVGWTTENALCLAPVGEKTYQITFVGGKTIDTNAINFKFFHQMGWGGEFGPSTLVSTSDIVLVGNTETNGHDNGNLFLADGKQLEEGGIYVFTIDLQGGINDAILSVDYKGQQQFEEKPIWVNGIRMWTSDNASYEATVEINQGAKVEFDGFAALSELWSDPDYFSYDENKNILTFSPVSGNYKFTLNRNSKTLSAKRVDADGNDMTLDADGNGAIWVLGWGIGSPSLNNQPGWNPGQAYCLAEIAPKIYQFTGVAGPENGSLVGDRFRVDYLDFKFFHQNGWGGEFSGDSALKLIGTASDFIKGDGNFNLADGVTLETGETYRITIDLSEGVSAGTINMVKL